MKPNRRFWGILETWPEREFQEEVVRVAETLGWVVYHTYDSRRSGAGFPDILAVRNGCLIVAELKSEKGKVSPEQLAWLDKLANVREMEVGLWRPSSNWMASLI